jgi:hypothetical protein
MAAFQDYAGNSATAAGGHYRIGFTTGAVTGLTANQYFFGWRWNVNAWSCRMRQIKVTANMNVAFGTAQISDVALWRCQGWSVAPTAGTAITMPTTNNQVMADQTVGASMAQFSSFISTATFAGLAAIASTGALTTGSPTVDANPLAYDVFNITALGSADRVVLYDTTFGIDYPLTFGNLEGFLLSVPTAQGATGKVLYYVDLVFQATNTAF